MAAQSNTWRTPLSSVIGAISGVLIADVYVTNAEHHAGHRPLVLIPTI